MSPEPDRYVFAFDEPPVASGDDRTRLLGGKGAGLVTMASDLGLPVPPGFTITTEACRAYLGGQWPKGLDEELRTQLDRLGASVGRSYGDPSDPLLVSVRSGAPVSMPGMMDTILDLGLSEASVPGLAAATGDEAFARDCLHRLREGWRGVIRSNDVPDDPWAQLRAAIEAVFRSWNGERAQAYRRHEGIPEDLGTAVTIQAMVFGNRGADSGTGVLFTRNPSTGEPEPYGDVMFNAQGEDVVAGRHEPQPITVLADRLPAVADELRRHADVLERHFADLCDIEFTIEQGRLWFLQVRVGKRSPRAALRMAIDMARDPDFPLSHDEAVRRVLRHLADPPLVFAGSGERPQPLAVGLPASPGVGTGEIVLTSVDAEAAASEGRPVILVRAETSPEDVPGMAKAAGVLTTRGGLASHAAVVARGWGIPAVVGAADVRLTDDGLEVGGRSLRAGEVITIDGTSGEVHAGVLAGDWEVAREAATLLGWADELGIAVVGASDEAPGDGVALAESVEVARELGRNDVLQHLLVKGGGTSEQLTEALVADADAFAPFVESIRNLGLAEETGGSLRLTDAGKLAALDAFGEDRSEFGPDRAIASLEAFHAFDGRMKEIVTAWQIRNVEGEQTLNDHTDPTYDAQVLEDLATLDAQIAEWLSPLADSFRRFAVYRSRLERALGHARGGDQRYVASPRVDSYHSVWFELHEDLIRLSGRKRSDEAAAGRA